MSESIKYPVIRHLEDDDNFLNKRDGSLLVGQEAEAQKLSEALQVEIKARGASIVLVLTSPKKRAIQTAEMVTQDLRARMKNVHIIQTLSDALADQDQGDVILPNNYEAGGYFPGFPLASGIFQKETFPEEDAGHDNLTYRFADPLLQRDGTYKYPELRTYFSHSGESYRDVLVRVLGELQKLSQNIKRFEDKNVLPVVFTHSQVQQIFKDLETVAERYAHGELAYQTGGLSRACWNIYKERKAQGKSDPSGVSLITIDALLNEEVVALLTKELEYLKAL